MTLTTMCGTMCGLTTEDIDFYEMFSGCGCLYKSFREELSDVSDHIIYGFHMYSKASIYQNNILPRQLRQSWLHLVGA